MDNNALTVKQAYDLIEEKYGNTMDVVSDCLRGMFKAPDGKKLICADFSQIEARVLAWLAGEQSVLDAFANKQDVYSIAASKIYKVPLDEVTPAQRQLGKVAVLALGYQGGRIAFARMAENYKIAVSFEEANTIKSKWRAAHPKIVKFWYELSRASNNAIKKRQTPFFAGAEGRKIEFIMKGQHLYARLPSGRKLAYAFAEVNKSTARRKNIVEEVTCMWTNNQTHKWERRHIYGGLLAENITQAVARDLLVHAMFKVENAGYPITMHVHDELLCEVPNEYGSIDEVCKLMCDLPEWAKGLPIDAEGWEDERFRK